MNPAQSNYSSNKGEIFAAIHFMHQWRYYLTQRKFILRTDHRAMKWIKTMEEPQGMILRWLETLSSCDFDVVFRPGTQHGNADSLSRADHATPLATGAEQDQPLYDVPTSSLNSLNHDDAMEDFPAILSLEAALPQDVRRLKALQNSDPKIVKGWVRNGKVPPKLELRTYDTLVRSYSRIFPQLRLDPRGILIRSCQNLPGRRGTEGLCP